jgi:hypothetical protein
MPPSALGLGSLGLGCSTCGGSLAFLRSAGGPWRLSTERYARLFRLRVELAFDRSLGVLKFLLLYAFHVIAQGQTSYRRWPMAIPKLNAFWRIAPAVLFIAFEILATGVLLFECALRSRTCSFVQVIRLVRPLFFRLIAIRFSFFESQTISTSRCHDKCSL